MAVTLVDNQVVWEQATDRASHFLQSYEWGEFQAAAGYPVLRLAVKKDGKTLAWQGFLQPLPLGLSYAYFPRVPTPGGSESLIEELLTYIKNLNIVFVRIEPIELLPTLSFHMMSTTVRQPQHTLMTDLTKTDEVLIASMHAKTRYNIHLARRHGVTVKEEKNAEIFWQLNTDTTARDKFRSHGKTYYEKMLTLPMVHQLTAYKDTVPIAANILIAHQGTMTYLHGASSNAHRNLMAPYLLQWEGMQLGKRLGMSMYDVWGVARPAENGEQFHRYAWETHHPWSGITRFKAGFGGEPFSYPASVDVVLRAAIYRLYRLAQRIRRVVY